MPTKRQEWNARMRAKIDDALLPIVSPPRTAVEFAVNDLLALLQASTPDLQATITRVGTDSTTLLLRGVGLFTIDYTAKPPKFSWGSLPDNTVIDNTLDTVGMNVSDWDIREGPAVWRHLQAHMGLGGALRLAILIAGALA